MYGASSSEVTLRSEQLEGHLDELVGPPQGCETPGHDGYKIGRIGPAKGGDGTAAGYSRTVQVTLYRRVSSQIRPPITIQHVTVTATAPAGGGATNPGSISAAT